MSRSEPLHGPLVWQEELRIWPSPVASGFSRKVMSYAAMLFLIIEDFRGDPAEVYRRLRNRGRLTPDGLQYVSSWVTSDLQRCYQVMACDDRRLLDQWMEQWQDLVAFVVVPVITSAEAADAVLATANGPNTSVS